MMTNAFCKISRLALAVSVVSMIGLFGTASAADVSSTSIAKNASTMAANEPSRPPVGCVWSRRVSNWQPVDDNSMIISQGRSRKYLVTFSSRCPQQRNQFALKIVRSYGSCLSAGDQVTFSSRFGFGSHYDDGMYLGTCVIQRIERLGSPVVG